MQLIPSIRLYSLLYIQFEVLMPEDDDSKRKVDLQTVMSGQTLVDDYKELKMTRNIAADGQAIEEYNFNSEVVLELQDPIWKEKYRPRKPRFFNRVHTVSSLFCCSYILQVAVLATLALLLAASM